MENISFYIPKKPFVFFIVILVAIPIFKVEAQYQLQWEKVFDSSFKNYPCQLALDQSNNVIFAYNSYDSIPVSCTTHLTKCDNNGNLLWSSIFQRPHPIGSLSISVNQKSEIYVCFKSDSGVELMKYGNAGNLLWNKVYNDSLASENYLLPIRITNGGNIVICISSTLQDDDNDVLVTTVKYDSLGNILWVNNADLGGQEITSPKALTLDDAENVYVTGSTNYWNGWVGNIFGLKINSFGTTAWYNFYYLPSGYSVEIGLSISSDKQKNLYIAGVSEYNTINLSEGKIVTIKIDTSGNKQWDREYPDSLDELQFYRGQDLTVGADGKIYVLGTHINSNIFGSLQGYHRDFIILQYDPSGNLLFDKLSDHTTPATNDTYPDKLIASDDGFYFTSGFNQGGCESDGNFIVDVFDSSGNILSGLKYGYEDTCLWNLDFQVDNSNNIYGLSWSWDGPYGPSKVIVTKHSLSIPLNSSYVTKEDYHLLIAPNPSTEFVSIELKNYFGENVTISVIDLIGREMMSREMRNNLIQLNTTSLSKGIYIVKAFSNHQEIASNKLVVE